MDSKEVLSPRGSTPGALNNAGRVGKREEPDADAAATAIAAAAMKSSEKSTRTSVPYFSLYKYADGLDYLYMFFGTVGAIADGLLLPTVVIIIIHLVNSFVTIASDPEGERRTAHKYITIMMWVAPIIGGVSFLEPSCWMRTGERQALRIRSHYLRAILRQNEGFFDTQGASTAEVVNSISADTNAIQEAISEKVGTFTAFMLNFFGAVGLALYMSWELGLIWIGACPLLIIPGVIYAKKLGATAGAMGFASKQAGSVAEQAISSVHTVYSFVGENRVLQAYSERLSTTAYLGARMGLYKSLAVGSSAWAYAIWALVLWVGSRLVIHHGLQGSHVLNAGFVAVNGIQGVGLAFGLLKFFSGGCQAAQRIFEVIDRVPEIDSWDENGKVLKKLNGTLELRNIQFAYPARPKAMIFSDFSLTIPAGCKVALVGDSGSGKSTVIALLERFYDPIKGQVLVDGVNIKELQLKWLRTQIGLVSQEPALFATSIKENILLGKENATFEEVVKASKSSNAHGFVEQFPDGYETQVGERGVKMSGGQKQRLAIARAILKNPPILLLDEATSALDAESERVVQDALDKVSSGRTTVIVAHRLSTIRDADLIAVMKDGQVVELGTHDKLSASGGAYANLVHLQQTRAVDISNREESDAPFRRSSSMEFASHSQRISFSHSMSQNVAKKPSSIKSVDLEDAIAVTTFQKPTRPSFRKLLAMNRPEWKQAVLGTIGASGFGAMFPMYSFLIASLMSGLYNPDHHAVTVQVRKFCLIFLGMSIAANIFSFLQHYNFAIMGERLTKRLRERLLAKILMFEVGWFDDDENSSGAIAARLATEASVARALVSDRMSLLLQTGVAITVAAVFSIILSWRLALFMLALQPVIIFSYLWKGQVLRLMYMSAIKAHEDSAQVASEAVSHHRTVTAFSAEAKVGNLFDTMQCGPKKVRSSQLRALVAGVGLGVANGLVIFVFALSLWWAQWLLQRGLVSVSSLFKVCFMIIATGRMIGETGSVATDIARSANSIVKVFNILDRRTLIDSEDKDGKKLEKVEGTVELRNVEFAYPTRPDVQVFKKLNLMVKSGRNIALVGRSGSGKSSIVSLIERFYDPVKGTVSIDGFDVKTLHLKTLRQHIALVSQEPTLFMGTIRENIQYGRENASEAEIVEAAKAANAYNFICSLKDGFNTNTGDRGLQLSGGQKQRIAIARAIIKNPSILLLDEATSALDAQSEKVVQDALDTVMVGRTTIIVAHRLSTIQNCDSIAVIKDGVVCEQGKHSNLLARGGAYSDLVSLQSKAAGV